MSEHIPRRGAVKRMVRRGLALLVMGLLAAGCAAAPQTDTGPRLLAESTLAPTTPPPTVTPSLTPDPLAVPTDAPTATAPSSEVVSPLQAVTAPADVIIVTPTLPPSKTPTRTPTNTVEPTQSPTPTQTVTATATVFLFPTVVSTPVPAQVIMPLPQLCPNAWAYIQPPPAGCPLAPATVGQGVYQTFERGHMIWVQQHDAIYVLYNDGQTPFWTRYPDDFDEFIHPWDDPNLNGDPSRPPNTWQPRRGFGKLWRERNATEVRNRVGWATMTLEQPYSVRVQTRDDGTLFVNDSLGRVFMLTPAGQWNLYAGYSF
jgi:hypothetical protein